MRYIFYCAIKLSYFSIKNQHPRFLLVSVIAGLIIPLANVLFPNIIVIALSGELSLPGKTLTSAVQILMIIAAFFIVTTLAQSVKAYVEKKFNWYGPYLQFKLREGIQYRAMTMDFPMTEDKDTLNKYSNAESAGSRAERIFGHVCGIMSSCVLIIVYSILVCGLHPALLILLAFNAWVGYVLMVKAKRYDVSFREPRAEIERRKNYLF